MMTVAHLKRIFRILSHNVSQNGVEERGVATDQHGHSSKSGPTRLSYQLITALSAIVMKIEKGSSELTIHDDNAMARTPSSTFAAVGYGVTDDYTSGVPEATFLLQGERTSGILLPSLCCFPSANRGFTFSTWICPKLASGAYSYRSRKPSRDNRDSKVMSEKLVRPVLLSLLQQNGEGITLHLEPKNCNASCDGTRRVVLTVWPPAKASRRPCSVGAALLTNDDDSNRGADDDEDDIIWHHISVKVHSSTYGAAECSTGCQWSELLLVQALQDSGLRVSSSSSKVFTTAC